jgi:hypothetical protein
MELEAVIEAEVTLGRSAQCDVGHTSDGGPVRGADDDAIYLFRNYSGQRR